MKGIGRTTIVFLAFFIIQHVRGQELKVSGGFGKDSIKIGEDVSYYLTVRYPRELNVLFPDSTARFFPFEYYRREYFPTQTNQGISYDSVIYHLRTFETDSIQHFTLPVYVVHRTDCTAVTAGYDSIRLITVLKALPDSVSLENVPLKRTVTFEPIPTSFNYIITAIVLGVLIIIAGAIWLAFGKKIMRHYLIKRLQRNHNRFIEDFNSNLVNLKNKPSVIIAESAATLWKKYLENLESRPYTKLTTKEIILIIQNDQIKESLRSIDRAIYGNREVTPHSFVTLKDFAEFEFRKKMQEVMHE